jgi:methionyl-tRNA synthetase
MPRTYVTTSIPYVNGSPHPGHALEFVLADAIARGHRLSDSDTRLQTGTDDNSLNNLLAAERAGRPVQEFVDEHADAFLNLLGLLDVDHDGFIRTSLDPGHRRGASALWEACAARGDLYRRSYHGLYCVGCEQFYAEAELIEGRCPEHGNTPEAVEEENWFFRLSRYTEQLLELFDRGLVRVVPETRLREARSFVAGGLEDFSVSRSRARAKAWGIPVPGDPGQVMYVWFDALINYVSALGYPDPDAPPYRAFWEEDVRRIHVVGKGILRFHAVYWPAMLLSAGLPLPDEILVHGYLQSGGAKLSKSRGGAPDPAELAQRLGADTLRYWLLRSVGQGADADFTEQRLLELRDAELANELGNLLQRTLRMIQAYRSGVIPRSAPEVLPPAPGLRQALTQAIAALDPQPALIAIWEVVRAANRHASDRQPWLLARQGREEELDAVLATLAEALRLTGEALRPFLPTTAGLILEQLGTAPAEDWLTALEWGPTSGGTRTREPSPLFAKSA